MKFEQLMNKAEKLGEMVNTDWAEENSDQYDDFEYEINKEYNEGNLTDIQFNTLALTAFYDYDDMKGVEEE